MRQNVGLADEAEGDLKADLVLIQIYRSDCDLGRGLTHAQFQQLGCKLNFGS